MNAKVNDLPCFPGVFSSNHNVEVVALVHAHEAGARIVAGDPVAATKGKDFLDREAILCLDVRNPDFQIKKVLPVVGCAVLVEDIGRVNVF